MIRSLLVVTALVLPMAGQAQAPRLSEIFEANMRPGWKTENGTYIAALHLRLAQDWITYWRHPGESGIVPKLDISGSRNLSAARILWPEPKLYIKAGFASIGYSDEIVLPIELTPVDAGQPVELDAILSVGVCADICIPVDLALNVMAQGSGTPDAMITSAMTRRPQAAHAAGLQGMECNVTPDKRGLRLSASLQIPPQGREEFVLIEMTGSTMPARVLPTERDGDTLTGHTLFRTKSGGAIDRSAVRISVVSEHGTSVHQGCAVSD
ncbi:protein-disulfide reductase DsbD domain-containing protein [Roseinatronobacter sp.]|uniref:protein-disulfide reductase DsbD domain-containing protein n=1 Tax=Roseinatronobacter sp. TaxID=1945755 RepID=UPI0025D176CA|nr:protein-disulfide reductase DsbD domain-containing protein [Rhodobaca sp.]